MDIPRKVYVIQNLTTGKAYVGSSSKPDKRFKAHLYALQAGRHIVEDFQEDYNRYGALLLFSIVDEIKEYAEREKEYIWMVKLKSYKRDRGYNYKDSHLFAKLGRLYGTNNQGEQLNRARTGS